MAKENLLERISLASNMPKAMKASIYFIRDELRKSNKDSDVKYRVEEEFFSDTSGYGDFGSYLEGYKLSRITKLEHPIIKKHFFGLIKKELTHKRKTIAYLDAEDDTLHVKENNKKLISLCKEVVKTSQKSLGKNHIYLALDYR